MVSGSGLVYQGNAFILSLEMNPATSVPGIRKDVYPPAPQESLAISQRHCPGAFQWVLLEQMYIFQGHMGAGNERP